MFSGSRWWITRLRRLWWWISGQGLVFLAGLALIVAGVVCLYLSDKVVTGWWQGTLDAFGVGFIVAGLVDVLAISALNRRVEEQRRAAAAQQRRMEQFEIQHEADLILRKGLEELSLRKGVEEKTADQARALLFRSGPQIDRRMREQLEHLISWPECAPQHPPRARPQLARTVAPLPVRLIER